MHRIKLKLKRQLKAPLEVEELQPSLLNSLSAGEIKGVTVQYGNKKEKAGEFFDVEIEEGIPEIIKRDSEAGTIGSQNIEAEAARGVLEFCGDLTKVKRIGQGMQRGIICINGSAGMHMGAFMSGGCIYVEGDTGDWTGAHMSGGCIRIKGSTGHFTGSAYWGHKLGMKGGQIVVEGSAGNMAGRLMRRGLIVILGNAGDFTAANMIAGTILVAGRVGRRTGAEMKRGTVLLTEKPELLPTFHFNCVYRPVFVNILMRWLKNMGVNIGSFTDNMEFERYAGDAVLKGKGEILVASTKAEPQQ